MVPWCWPLPGPCHCLLCPSAGLVTCSDFVSSSPWASPPAQGRHSSLCHVYAVVMEMAALPRGWGWGRAWRLEGIPAALQLSWK